MKAPFFPAQKYYRHLGPFSDWVGACNGSKSLWPVAKPGHQTRRRLRECLAFEPGPVEPRDLRVHGRWERDDVVGEEVSWWVGYGPRTRAWVLKPKGAVGRLPGVVVLHDHGGFKFYGKEKVADGAQPAPPCVVKFRKIAYGGRAVANELARAGFVVLVHDVFLWGSRRVPLAVMPEFDRWVGRTVQATGNEIDYQPPAVARYNWSALFHEHTMAKYCAVLGTTLAGVVNYEDRVAVEYLAARADVTRNRIGCVGLSGGGMRSVLLQGTCSRIRAAVVVGAMSTFEGLLDHSVGCHTWLFFPAGWARYGDWPDIAAARAPSPLLVQFARDDPLFSQAGMKAADRRLAAHYQAVGAPHNYQAEFYPGPHQFSRAMQAAAIQWLKKELSE